jgi:Fe-S cluster assembly iron-binding protein IscA
MLNVTRAAGDHLREMLERVQAPGDSAIRIVVKPDGLKTTVDRERTGDVTLDHEGRRVLLLDARAADVLSGRTLDVDSEGPEGLHLICLA